MATPTPTCQCVVSPIATDPQTDGSGESHGSDQEGGEEEGGREQPALLDKPVNAHKEAHAVHKQTHHKSITHISDDSSDNVFNQVSSHGYLSINTDGRLYGSSVYTNLYSVFYLLSSCVTTPEAITTSLRVYVCVYTVGRARGRGRGGDMGEGLTFGVQT